MKAQPFVQGGARREPRRTPRQPRQGLRGASAQSQNRWTRLRVQPGSSSHEIRGPRGVRPQHRERKDPQSTGDSDFGRGCLMARKLVQSGVKLVEVTLDGWDTHKDGFTRLEKLPRHPRSRVVRIVDRSPGQQAPRQHTGALPGRGAGRTPKLNDTTATAPIPSLERGARRRWHQGGHRAWRHRRRRCQGRQGDLGADLLATAMTLLGLDPSESVGTPAGRPISLDRYGLADSVHHEI